MSEESSEDLGRRLNAVASGSGPLLVVELWVPSREGSEAGLLCEVGLRLITSVLGAEDRSICAAHACDPAQRSDLYDNANGG